MKRLLSYTAFAVVALGAGAASAATVNVGFEGSPSGGVYTENGFTFTSNSEGGVSLATCPPTGGCLQLNNNETITVTYSDGLFDLVSFSFRSPGSGGALEITDNNNSQLISENLGGNDLQFISFPGEYEGILSFSWTNDEQGSGRVDNIAFNITAIPLPAAGWLLLAGVGGLAAMRRRKQAA